MMFPVPLCVAVTLALSAGFPGNGQVPDPDITNVVDREFLIDPAFSSDAIDVNTHDGVVTLTGSVDSLLARERAALIAETVKGVRSVVNRIDVQPGAPRADDAIEQDIHAALVADPAADAFELQVEVLDGHAILRGTVESWRERSLAETVAKGVKGVRELTNEIGVSPRDERADAEILAEIREALRWNAFVDHGLVRVAVNDGRVALTGAVGSAAEKRQAETTAWTAGVTHVDTSGLSVERWARDEDLRRDKYVIRSAEELRTAVEDALRVDPRVLSYNVATDVSGRVVTLRGVVANLKAKRAAKQDALGTVGVAFVRNELKVRPEEERPADAIEGDVENALLRDPYVDRYDIDVDVHDGVVYLDGNVTNGYEHARAEDLASGVRGVTDVVNRLRAGSGIVTYDPFVDPWYYRAITWYDASERHSLVDDAVLKAEIEDELFWSPFVDSDDVEVTVEDGVATLRGTVDSWMERGVARDNAFEGGATHVRNRLAVASAGSGSGSL